MGLTQVAFASECELLYVYSLNCSIHETHFNMACHYGTYLVRQIPKKQLTWKL